MNQEEKQKILQAGKIALQVKVFAKSLVKGDMPLLEIAEKIEGKILEFGGKPAFPVNLCINEIAAHYTPDHNDKNLAHGLLKVDIGIQVDGWIADTAFSLDLENSKENKKLIEASEKALEKAIEEIKKNRTTNASKIGGAIQKAIESFGFSPIINLSGHQIKRYSVHAGINIPNTDDKRDNILGKGIYAIEPFATNGNGKVHDGKPSGIYKLIEVKNTRSPVSKEILSFISKEYKTLPFCSRWIVKKFGVTSLFALRQLKEAGVLHEFPQLVEKSSNNGTKVSQAEHTILVDDDVIVTTE